MGTRTDAALAQVVAARADLGEQVDRLEAAGRAAIDVPAKVRANPAKAAGIAAGGAFLAVGGPKRLFRRARRAITGKEEELPSELLPKDVEKALRKIGTDGSKVRGTLERDFAKYLDDRAKERKKEGVTAAIAAIALSALRPIAIRGGRQVAERMLDPNGPKFAEQLERIRARRSAPDAADAETAAKGAPKDAGL
ncbi:MAG TPA: hypothetical protein VHM48_03505 [Candidatus Limnocylindrales bacterium]|nr:hypothetical protein [Candidatus Limnocylindrales bacterium]